MKQNRINEMVILLNQKKSISINELCNHFNVSLNTIRRDITELCNQGIASKVYGGIVLNEEKSVIPYNMRSVSNLNEKIQLARLASKFIDSNETIYVDSGTTTVNILPYISKKHNLTIISSSLNVYNEAIRFEHLNVIATGGLLYQKTNSFIGMSVIDSINSYHINKAFMAATGVCLESGANNNSYHEAEIKKSVINRCKKIILMVDHTKIDKSASILFCPLESLYAFVTDKKPPQQYIDFFKTHNIECLYPEN